MKYSTKSPTRTRDFDKAEYEKAIFQRTYPPYHLEPRIPPSDPKHVCCICHTGVRHFEVLDKFGIVSMVCSEECFNMWILKKT